MSAVCCFSLYVLAERYILRQWAQVSEEVKLIESAVLGTKKLSTPTTTLSATLHSVRDGRTESDRQMPIADQLIILSNSTIG